MPDYVTSIELARLLRQTESQRDDLDERLEDALALVRDLQSKNRELAIQLEQSARKSKKQRISTEP